MNNFLSEIKYIWQKKNSELEKLIIINVAVFILIKIVWVLFTLFRKEEIIALIDFYLIMPPSIEGFLFKPWTLITYFFMHNDFFHILMNMLMLYWFGNIFRNFLGSQKLLSIYILGGISGGLFYILAYNLLPLLQDRIDTSAGLLGASGGVLAVITATATLVPNYKVQLIFIGSISIKYIAWILIFLSIIGTVGNNAGGEFAHLGGAFIGYFFIRQSKKGIDLGKGVMKTLGFFSKLFKQKNEIKIEVMNKPPTTNNKNQQDLIDKILDKISENGYDNLTEEEKQILFDASKK